MELTSQQQTERLIAMSSRQRTVGVIDEVKESDDGYYLSYDHHGSFLSKEHGVVPEVGQEITVYAVLGSQIRGVDIEGEPVYFKTQAELDADHQRFVERHNADLKARFEEHRAAMDEQIAALPEPFQRRIAWFKKNNPDFEWEYQEYELAACNDAAKIIRWAEEASEITGPPLRDTPRDLVQIFKDASATEQRRMISDLAYDEHSGNTFSTAVMLALHYTIDPEWVFFDHGALVPLVGCADYGCFHPRPGQEEFIARHTPQPEASNA